MALARKYQIIPGQPGFFHCYSRCVRRAFLCGCDPLTGRDFSHRRQWIVDRLALLCQAFAVDLYAYAVMSNHVHLVLFIDPERSRHWSDEQVIERWRSLYRWRGPERESPLPTPEQVGEATLAVWRERLGSVSWLMKSLNEPLAHLANAEDDCRGHFWEGRFGSTALLDEPAVLAAMAYVDLNPIKAKQADALISSEFTSIQRRLREQEYSMPPHSETDTADGKERRTTEDIFSSEPIPAVFSSAPVAGPTQRPGATLHGYLILVEAGAESHLIGKPDVRVYAQQTLERFSLALPQWLQAVAGFGRLFRRVAGATSAVDRFVRQIGRQRRIDVVGSRLLSPLRKTTKSFS